MVEPVIGVVRPKISGNGMVDIRWYGMVVGGGPAKRWGSGTAKWWMVVGGWAAK